MQAEFDLRPLAVEDAAGHQRPKIEEYGNSLFAVLHMIEPADGELRVGQVDIFVARNYILSVRSGFQNGFSEVRARCESEPELVVAYQLVGVFTARAIVAVVYLFVEEVLERVRRGDLHRNYGGMVPSVSPCRKASTCSRK